MLVAASLDEVTELHVRRAVDSLVDEFGDRYDRTEIDRLVRDSLDGLIRGAEVNDFVPTLAYRFARERPLVSDRQPRTGEFEVLFVGLGDTGRGQMAAALITLRSEGRIVAHSAGSAAAESIDPTVVEAMAELEVDLTDAYAKPLTDEVLQGVDVVVTMGRSVGQVTLPSGRGTSTGESEIRLAPTSPRCARFATRSTSGCRPSWPSCRRVRAGRRAAPGLSCSRPRC